MLVCSWLMLICTDHTTTSIWRSYAAHAVQDARDGAKGPEVPRRPRLGTRQGRTPVVAGTARGGGQGARRIPTRAENRARTGEERDGKSGCVSPRCPRPVHSPDWGDRQSRPPLSLGVEGVGHFRGTR